MEAECEVCSISVLYLHHVAAAVHLQAHAPLSLRTLQAAALHVAHVPCLTITAPQTLPYLSHRTQNKENGVPWMIP